MIDKNSIMEILSQTKLYEKNLAKVTDKFSNNIKSNGIVNIGSFSIYDDRAKLDYQELLYNRFGKDIYYFADTLNKQLPKKDLRIMESNIRDIKIKRNFINSIYMDSHGILQFYDPTINLISTNYHNDKTKGIYHELLHMSSSSYDSVNRKIYCGFMYGNEADGYEIGRSINEGYTELLNQRLFGYNIKRASKPYRFSTVYAEKLERIIGQEEMTHLYFKHDLNDLIMELEKYKTKEEIFKFFEQTDYLIKEEIGKKDKKIKVFGVPVMDAPVVPGKEEYTINNFLDINEFLIDAYTKKVNEKPISKKEKVADVNNFINDLRREQIDINNNYQYTSMLKDYSAGLSEDSMEGKMKL